jgi:hypothetical protein
MLADFTYGSSHTKAGGGKGGQVTVGGGINFTCISPGGGGGGANHRNHMDRFGLLI